MAGNWLTCVASAAAVMIAGQIPGAFGWISNLLCTAVPLGAAVGILLAVAGVRVICNRFAAPRDHHGDARHNRDEGCPSPETKSAGSVQPMPESHVILMETLHHQARELEDAREMNRRNHAYIETLKLRLQGHGETPPQPPPAAPKGIVPECRH